MSDASFDTVPTMVVRDGTIEHVFYPVFPPDRSAEPVLDRLRGH